MEKVHRILQRFGSAPLFGIVIAVFLIIFSYQIGAYQWLLFFFALLMVSVIATIRGLKEGLESFKPDLRKFKFLSSLFFLLLTLSISVYYSRPDDYARPLFLFVIYSTILVVLFYQALFSDRSWHKVTLIQVIIIGTAIPLSTIFLFPELMGRDPWFHRLFATTMFDIGTIPNYYTAYTQRPIFQLLMGSVMYIAGLEYLEVGAAAAAVLVSIASLFVYLITRLVLKNSVVGLITSIVAISGSYFIGFGFYFIPSVLSFILILPVIFVLYKYIDSYKIKNQHFVIALVVSLTILFTHPYGFLGLIAILMMIFLMERFVLGNHRASRILSILSMSLILFLSWLFYLSNEVKRAVLFFQSIGVLSGEESIESGGVSPPVDNGGGVSPPVNGGGSTPPDSWVAPDIWIPSEPSVVGDVFDYLAPINSTITDTVIIYSSMMLTILLITFGFYMASKNRITGRHKTFFWMVVSSTVVVGSFSMLEIYFIGSRWLYFCFLLSSVVIAYFLYNSISSSPVAVRYLTTGAVLFILFFSSMYIPMANYDNRDLYDSVRHREALTQSEITIGHFSGFYFTKSYSDDYHSTRMSFYDVNMGNIRGDMSNVNSLSSKNSPLVYRQHFWENGYGDSFGLYLHSEHNTIYCNDYASLHLP